MTVIDKRLIARGRGWYCNLPITHIVKDGPIVYAWRGDEFVGSFDIGSVCVDVLYQTEVGGAEP